MVNKMRSSDFVSVVAYDSVGDLIVPITDCRDKNRIIKLIQSIYEGGMTNLQEWLVNGCRTSALKKNANSINRILLLSDGNANEGITDINELKKQSSRLAETNITTSTYGLQVVILTRN